MPAENSAKKEAGTKFLEVCTASELRSSMRFQHSAERKCTKTAVFTYKNTAKVRKRVRSKKLAQPKTMEPSLPSSLTRRFSQTQISFLIKWSDIFASKHTWSRV